MARKFSNGIDLQNQKAVNLADPSSATDAANKSYVDNVARGLAWKDSVQAASTANVSVSSAPATLDGVTLANGDRVLLKNQTTGAENGIYTFTVAAAALTRAADADNGTELRPGTAVSVNGGTVNADTAWHITSPDSAVTIGTTATTWSPLGGGSGVTSFQTRTGAVTLTKADVTGTGLTASDVSATAKFAAAIGDGSSTAITVTHNLGTRDVTVEIYDAATFDEIECDVAHTTVNTLTVTFATAPAASAYRVVVVG